MIQRAFFTATITTTSTTTTALSHLSTRISSTPSTVMQQRQKLPRSYHVLATLFFCLLFTCSTCTGQEILSEPNVRSTYSIPSASFRRGNGIATTSDGNTIVTTSRDGSLHILKTGHVLNGRNDTTLVYQPASASALLCESKPVMVEREDGSSSYAMYSVVQSNTNEATFVSYLLAINLRDASLRWNVTLPGSIVGTPLFSPRSSRVFCVHNVYNEQRGRDEGRVSVIAVSDQQGIAAVAATLPEVSTGTPFGPATLKSIPSGGNNNNDRNNNNEEALDVLFFGETRNDGFSARGSLYAVIQTSVDDRGSYDFVLASDFPGSGVTPPAVSSTLDVYLGTQASYLVGFTSGRGFEELVPDEKNNDRNNNNNNEWDGENYFPRWIMPLEVNPSMEDAPIPAAPILSPDEKYVFSAAAGNEITCIEVTNNGAVISWSVRTDGVHYASPIYQEFPEDDVEVLYFLEKDSGVLRQINAFNGDVRWEVSVPDAAEVEADFVISPNGGLLFYGSVSGDLVAINIAAVETEPPTPEPTAMPTISPTEAPTMQVTTAIATTAIPTTDAATSGAPTTLAITEAPTTSVVVDDGTTDGDDGNVSEGDEGGNDETENNDRNIDKNNQESDNNDDGNDSNDVAAVANAADQGNPPSNSSKNGLPIYLGAACGAMAFLTLFAFFIVRRKKQTKKQLAFKEAEIERDLEAAAEKMYEDQKKEYERECAKNETETLQAINANRSSSNPKPRSLSMGSNASRTPSHLESIAESPGDVVEEPIEKEVEWTSNDGDKELGFEISYDKKEHDTHSFKVQTETVNKLVNPDPEEDEIESELSASIEVSAASPKSSTAARARPTSPTTDEPDFPAVLPQLSTRKSDEVASESQENNSFPKKETTAPQNSNMTVVSNDRSVAASSVAQTADDSTDIEGYSTIMDDTEDDSNIEVEIASKDNLENASHLSRERSIIHTVPSQESDMVSCDDSLYVDEPSLAGTGVGGGSVGTVDVFEKINRALPKIEEPDDEPPAILSPGAHYLERNFRKPSYGNEPVFLSTPTLERDSRKPSYGNEPIISNAPKRTLDPEKVKPIYKGVSVRPSRSKAGIFSRRFSRSYDSQIESSILNHNVAHQALDVGNEQTETSSTSRNQIQPTPTSYYVEEKEERLSYSPKAEGGNSGEAGTSSAWSSLLQELSQAENEFYSPVSPSKSPDQAESQALRPNRPSSNNKSGEHTTEGYGSDSSEGDSPPPPPRTFYA